MSTEQPESTQTQGVSQAAPLPLCDYTASDNSNSDHKASERSQTSGKLVAERTRIARETQKKAAAEGTIIIANNKAIAATVPPATAL